ncbi:MAG: hypothetical protein NC311_01055 [Muribaculaceae bacterium]|nr:hypothetical protein [Muribaculaceae bacterium]
MKKLITFMAGVMLLVIMFIIMFFAGAIFDMAGKQSVETYFFQGNSFSDQRPGAPKTPKDLGDVKMFDMLVTKYVNDYFYVLPDMSNIEQRQSPRSALDIMSAPDVFAQWKDNIAPQITEMANAGMLRTVSVTGIQRYGDYHAVEYQLKTWHTPNDMDELPQIETGIIYLLVSDTPRVNDYIMENMHTVIERGRDLVIVFQGSFRVEKAIMP